MDQNANACDSFAGFYSELDVRRRFGYAARLGSSSPASRAFGARCRGGKPPGLVEIRCGHGGRH